MECIPNDHPYAPLDPTYEEIRLLYLLPGQYHHDVNCVIEHSSLPSRPIYEALSYCWGDTRKTEPIMVDGRLFHATESLSIALRYLRSEDTSRILWVDALCINQADRVERGHQVRLMGSIYVGARQVIVWLGEEEVSEEEICADQPFPCDEKSNAVSSPKISNEKVQEQCIIDGVDIRAMYHRPWWQRIWVIQEIAIRGTYDVIVQYGRRTIDWGSLWGSWANDYLQGGNEDTSLTAPYEIISSLKREIMFGGKPALLDLLKQFRYWRATDPRDKIYALVGMSGGHGRNFPIDYTKSVTTVYMDLVIYLVNHEKALDIISHSSTPKSFDGLPSWAPDWSIEGTPYLTPRTELLRRNSKLQIYSSSANVEPRITFWEPNILATTGILFDIVRLAGDELPSEDLSLVAILANHPQSTVMERWEAMAFENTDGADPYFGLEGRFEAFCRTLVADTDHQEKRAQPQMFDKFLSWCKRPQLPGKESTALKVAQSLGYVVMRNDQGCDGALDHDESDTCDSRCEEPFRSSADCPSSDENGDKDALTPKNEVENSNRPGDHLPFSSEFTTKFLEASFSVYKDSGSFSRRMADVAVGRRLIISQSGYIGLGPPDTHAGDLICILFGGQMPFILRVADAVPRYTLIGECYVHGIMDGEVLEDPARPTLEEQEFLLV